MEQKRTINCDLCYHATSYRKQRQDVFCDQFELYEHIASAHRCPLFQLAPGIVDKFNGYPIRNMTDGLYLTEKQWNKEGYILKDTATGTKMYASLKAAKISKDNLTVYYSEDEVIKENTNSEK